MHPLSTLTMIKSDIGVQSCGRNETFTSVSPSLCMVLRYGGRTFDTSVFDIVYSGKPLRQTVRWSPAPRVKTEDERLPHTFIVGTKKKEGNTVLIPFLLVNRGY